MPLDQRNFNYFSYDSDDASTSFCIRGDAAWGANADSGGSACAGEPAYGRATARRHPRYAVFRDPTTFRTFKSVVYTPAAFAALTIGDTLAVSLPGSATPQNYTLVQKINEKLAAKVVGRQLIDHA